MAISKNSVFYKKATEMLQAFKIKGGKIEELTADTPEYKYIKNARLYDESGNLMDLEAKFEFLGYTKKSKKTKNLREELIEEIKEYLVSGGSFHIQRKKLPFYQKLHSYKMSLKHQGKELTHEEIMKYELGFVEYSDNYFRCQGIEKFKYFRDENGYVDAYKKHKKFHNYIKEIARTYNMPLYFVTTLLADEKLKRYEMSIDKVKFTERLLYNYAAEHGTFVGIKRKDPSIYEAFNYLIKYYSDGTEQRYSKQEWLEIFGLSHVENRFRDVKKNENLDISNLMLKLQKQYQGETVVLKDLDTADYHTIIKKAVKLGVDVSQIFKMYGMKCKGITIDRLSKVWVEEIPYVEEMMERRDYLISQNLKKASKKPCKEEIFEAKLAAVIQVYQEFKEKLENYIPEKIELPSELTDETTNNV